MDLGEHTHTHAFSQSYSITEPSCAQSDVRLLCTQDTPACSRANISLHHYSTQPYSQVFTVGDEEFSKLILQLQECCQQERTFSPDLP